MSTTVLHTPLVARPARVGPTFWQRMLRVFDEIGRYRAQRHLAALACRLDETASPDLARQARQVARALA